VLASLEASEQLMRQSRITNHVVIGLFNEDTEKEPDLGLVNGGIAMIAESGKHSNDRCVNSNEYKQLFRDRL
jgi:cytolysin (calcineurin-like family phosphatase)